VLIDVNMAGMDGIMLARSIKSDPRISQTRIIMLTSLDRRGDVEAFRECGVDDYVTKPVKRRSLFDALLNVLASTEGPKSIMAGLTVMGAGPPEPEPEPVVEKKPGLRILIAEDNSVNQKVALNQLQKLGHTAEAVDNGRMVLEALELRRYDIVFMDCQMPELDGYAATGEIRRIEGKDRHTWIVAMTAHSLEGDREKCLAAGMDDYISKPVKIEALRDAIECFLGLQSAQREAVEEGGQAIVDPTALQAFRELDPDGSNTILAQLISVFLENLPALIGELREAIGGCSASQTARVAHTLKGSCSNFGAHRMRDACMRLERLGSSGSLDGADAILAEIEREFGYVRVALEKELPPQFA
jgi:CheY-like chemotaxis protein